MNESIVAHAERGEQVEITCERGLGRMFDGRCAGRWREANGKVPGVSERRVAELQKSKCAGCPWGKQRADAGAHQRRDPGRVIETAGPAAPAADVLPSPPHDRARVQIEKRLSRRDGRGELLSLGQVRERLLQRAIPAAHTQKADPPPRVIAAPEPERSSTDGHSPSATVEATTDYGTCLLPSCGRPLGETGKWKPYCSIRCERENGFALLLAAEPQRDASNTEQEEPMAKKEKTTLLCSDCSEVCPRTGPRQLRCEKCAAANTLRKQRERRTGKPEPSTRTGGGERTAARTARAPREPRAARMPDRDAAPSLAGGYRVRVGKLEIECASLPALLELVDHFGGA